MKVRIEIDTKTFVRFWLVVIGFALATLAIFSAREALVILGSAFFLALALNRPVSYLASHLPGKSRVGGTAIAFLVVVALLGVFVFLVLPPIIQQSTKFIESIPAITSNATTQWKGIGNLIDKYHLQPQVNSALSSLQDNTARWASNLGGNVVSGVGSVVGFVTSVLLALVLCFFMLVEGPAWLKRIWGIYGDQDRMEYHRKLTHRMYNVVTGYVTGQLIVTAIGAALAGITVFAISFFLPIPSNLALPTVAITFILSLIPMFGATLSGVLIALLLALNDVSAGIIYAVFFIIYQQIENNFVSPAIQSRKLELSPLAVLASVTVGLYVFGLAGGIISIPIAGCIKVLAEEYFAQAKKGRIRSEKPIAKLVKKIQEYEA